MTDTDRLAAPRCDVVHALRYAEFRPADFDLGRYVRVSGIPGQKVRYLCTECARGRVTYRFDEQFPDGRRLRR